MADQLGSAVPLWGDDATVRWLLTVLHFLWQGAVIGAVAATVGNLLRGASAQSRYITYLAAIVSLPVCMAITFFVVNVPSTLASAVAPGILSDEVAAETGAISHHEPGIVAAADRQLVAERDGVSQSL